MKRMDTFFERRTRNLAKSGSRRGFLARLGVLMTGAAAFPLLPVSRAFAAPADDPGDPTECEYWRHCGFSGTICACCGGSQSLCPPGSTVSPIAWLGTCRNPGDEKDYVISYNDCCGGASCGRCECHRNDDDTPVHTPFASNDIHWCTGSPDGLGYSCTIAAIVGVHDGQAA